MLASSNRPCRSSQQRLGEELAEPVVILLLTLTPSIVSYSCHRKSLQQAWQQTEVDDIGISTLSCNCCLPASSSWLLCCSSWPILSKTCLTREGTDGPTHSAARCATANPAALQARVTTWMHALDVSSGASQTSCSGLLISEPSCLSTSN